MNVDLLESFAESATMKIENKLIDNETMKNILMKHIDKFSDLRNFNMGEKNEKLGLLLKRALQN